MAQTGYNQILIYASGTSSNVPSASNLTSSASGSELAINYADGNLYYKDSGGTVQLLASKTATSGSYSNLTVTGSSAPANGMYLPTTNAVGISTNSTERVRVDANGNSLFGTSNSSLSAGEGFKVIYNTGTNPYTGSVMSSSSNSQTTYHLYSTGAAAYRFYVGAGGTVYATNTTISAISDVRLKENIRDLNVGLDAVMALKPRLYDWKEGKGANIKNARGFIAQEFEQVFPDLIDEWKDPAPNGEVPYKSVRQDLIPVLVKAIQELKADLDATKAELQALKVGQ